MSERIVCGPLLPRDKVKDSEKDDDNQASRSQRQGASSTVECYGPALPPGFKSKDEKTETAYTTSNEDVNSVVSCGNLYGPVLPPGFNRSSSVEKDCHDISCENEPDDNREREKGENSRPTNMYGPALPTKLAAPLKPSGRKVYGPTLPGIQDRLGPNDDDNGSDDDDDVIGPMPSMGSTEETNEFEVMLSRKHIEARSTAMKDKLTGSKKGEEKLERESWMLELPPEIGKNFGLGPRTFRSKAVELGDRSVWTDTPQDKAKRKEPKVKEEDLVRPQVSQKESALRQEVEEYNKAKRPVSLMEMHKEKLKKQKLDGEGPSRRPFNRDTDLATHRSDPRAKAKFLSSSQKMAEKFQSGQFENKFL